MPLLRCPDDALAVVLAFAGHHAAPLRTACRRLAGLRAGHGRGVALVYLRRANRAFDAAARLPSHPAPPGTGTLVLLVQAAGAPVRLFGARDDTAEAAAALEQAARRYPDATLLVYAHSDELSAAVAALWPRASVLTGRDGWDVRAPYSGWARSVLATVTPRCGRVQYDRASERCIADAVCGMAPGCAVWLRDRETAPGPHTELFRALARQAVRVDTHLARLDWGAVVDPTGPPLHVCVLADEQRGGTAADDLPLPPRPLPRVVSMELVDVLPADTAGFAAAFPRLRFVRFVNSAGRHCAPITGSEAERLTALLRLPQLHEYDTDAQTLPVDRLLRVGVARRDAGCVPLAVHRPMARRRGACACGPVPLSLTGHEPGLCLRDEGWAERYGMLGTGLTAQM